MKADEILTAVQVQRVIQKALVFNREIDNIINRIKDILTNTWAKETRDSVIEALRQIDSYGDRITQAQITRVQKQIERNLGRSFATLVERPIFRLQEAAYLIGGREGASHTGARFSFGGPDTKALAALEKNLLFWVGDYYKDDLQQNVNSILTDFFLGGDSVRGVRDRLIEQLGIEFDRAPSYWELLADHTASKVREIGRVAGYERTTINRVQFVARIDERTTDVCRRMNGKIIEVPAMRKQVDRYLDACEGRNPEKVKSAWKWWDDKTINDLSDRKLDKLIAKGEIGIPPLHARCRSLTVAYFGD